MEPRSREEREDRREEEKRDFVLFRARDVVRLDESLELPAYDVIGAAIEVHRVLAPGLPESVYRKALSHELTLRGIPRVAEASVPVDYKGQRVGEGRVDLLVGGRLVIELKVVEAIADLHKAQVTAYLPAPNLQLGLLINFNVAILADGLRRVIRSS